MARRLRFCLVYFAFWMVYFVLLRGVFLVYHFRQTAGLSTGEVLRTFWYGARMDMSASSYTSVVAFALVALSSFLPGAARAVIATWTVGMLVLVSLLATIDLRLFDAWGFRIDGTPLLYLNTPKEMWASAGSSPVALLLCILTAMAGIAVTAFLRFVFPLGKPVPAESLPARLLSFVVLAGLTWSLYYPGKGGFQLAPMTQSTVYFSHKNFANQAAINVAWNFFDSVWWRSYSKDNPYHYMEPAEAERRADSLLASDRRPAVSLLNTSRPNVLIIIWESLTAKVVTRLGGLPGVTPNLDSLTREGVLFDHYYSTGGRSVKGISGILSGYPAQPMTVIIQSPRKTASLPFLTRDLAPLGYHSSFYYGGELEFANIKSYLVNAGFDRLVDGDAFDAKEKNSKWGAHDHVVLARLLADLHAEPQPFFCAAFTLSSHEPFEVPMAPVFPGTDEQTRFLNAQAYTDRSLGDFVRKAKTEPWWARTLVIIMADHGHRLPVLGPNEADRRWEVYHIPMLWLGGALARRDTVIRRLGAQTDFPRTLLDQMGVASGQYRWSRDLLAPGIRDFAYFAFEDGFGWVKSDGAYTWDNVGKAVMFQEGRITSADVRDGQAMLQATIADYVAR